MPDEPQNPTPEENSIPASSQEPTEPAPENATVSEPFVAPSEAPESSPSDFSVKSNDILLSDSMPETIENKAEIEEIELKPENIPENQTEASETVENTGEIQPEPEKPLENDISTESVPSEAIPASSAGTAQIPVNEPLESETQSEPEIPKPEFKKQEIEPELKKEEKTEVKTPESTPAPSEAKTEPKQEEVKLEPAPIPIPIVIPKKNLAKELLIKARNAIQFRKRKKLDKVMILFLKKSKITNDEVEKFLHVSDATATRYLSQLEKEGKIKQSGKIGKGVSYSRI